MALDPNQFRRKYRYRGTDTDKEQKRFWIVVLITLAIVFGIIYLF
ncbi:hypothetical protein [Hufsiella ginkgonis]|nr:hypothetical protein [Hufsiella ginkgonis]